MKKYRLYEEESAFTSKNAALESYLGIPREGTLHYASISRVENPASLDYGKYIMPVCMDAQWKCDDQFDPSKLVDYDPTWNVPLPIT